MILLAGALMIVSFQNFTGLPLEKLKPEFPQAKAYRKTADGSMDIRDLAPEKPSMTDNSLLTAPTSGNDLGSVSRDWMERQGKSLAGGADERLLASINRKIERWMRFEPVNGESWPEPGDDSSGSKGEGSDDGGDSAPSTPGMPSFPGGEDMFGLKPTSVRLANLNQLELGFRNRSHLSCQVNGSNVQLDLSRPLSERMDVNLRHDSGQQSNSVLLKYNW